MLVEVGGRAIGTYDRLITGPTVEPLDLDEAKKYLRFTATSEDTLIDTMIAAARQYFEQQTGVICITQTWELGLSGAPVSSEIELPRAPLQSVVSIVSGDDDDTFGTGNYSMAVGTGAAGSRGRVRLTTGSSWPSVTTVQSAAIRVRYTAGFGDAPGDVPELVKLAIGMILGSFHGYRSETIEPIGTAPQLIPFGAAQIIREFKYRNVPLLGPRYTWPS